MPAPSRPASLFRLDGSAAETDLLTPLSPEQISADRPVDLPGTRARLVAGAFRTEAPQWLQHAEALGGGPLDLPS
ncbi:hypothetical protein ABT279_46910, partial [Amycolatopsis sp. NPDC000673]